MLSYFKWILRLGGVSTSVDRKSSEAKCMRAFNLIQKNTISNIMEHFHKFDVNIRFTYDLLENTSPFLLDDLRINFVFRLLTLASTEI